MAGIHVKFEVSPEKFLAELTEAAYGVALKHGLAVPFIEVELDLHQVLRKVIQRDMLVSKACGSPECLSFKTKSLKPWSQGGKRLFKEMS